MKISNDLNDDRYQNIRIVLTLSSLNLYEFHHAGIEFPVDEDVFVTNDVVDYVSCLKLNSDRFVNEATNRALKVGVIFVFSYLKELMCPFGLK